MIWSDKIYELFIVYFSDLNIVSYGFKKIYMYMCVCYQSKLLKKYI